MPEKKPQWKVYCLGTIRLDMDRLSVIASLQKLFGVTAEKADSMLSGKSFLVKSLASRKDAEKYLQALESCGANATIKEPELSPTKGLSLTPIDNIDQRNDAPPATRKPQPETATAKQFYCPKCQTPQTRNVECIKCGIIFDKYFEVEQRKQQAAIANEDNPDDNYSSVDPFDTAINFIKNKYVIAATIIFFIVVKFFIFDGAGYEAFGTTETAQKQWQTYQNALAMPKPASDEILSMLKYGEYSEVERILESLEANVAGDIIWEEAYTELYSYFDPANKFKQSYFDNWVSSTQSAYAYLARASFYYNAGWDARGDKFSRKTSAGQFKSLAQLHSLAVNDAKQAKGLNSQLLYFYALTIALERTAEEYIDIDSVLQEAIALNPAAASYRDHYIESILPKWGGSYDAMQHFVNQQSEYFNLNPMLTTLAGYANAQNGFYAKNKGDFDLCISEYSKALSHGMNINWLDTRSWCSMKAENYQDSLNDVNLSLSIRHNPKIVKIKKYSEYKLR